MTMTEAPLWELSRFASSDDDQKWDRLLRHPRQEMVRSVAAMVGRVLAKAEIVD
jgi:hypothetical protein